MDNQRRRAWLLRGCIVLGVVAVLYYFSWWRDAGRILSPWLAMALVLAALYHWAQLLGSWLLYLAADRRPPPPPPPATTSVDVFVTACGESPALVERALRAACRMRGEHRTWLLDDGDDPSLQRLADRYGAGYLTRAGNRHAKAGNLNAALARTTGDVVVVFDVDHAPAPVFLERTLGYFTDPDVGFVQTMLTFANADRSWVARAAAESSLDFYGPASLGMDRLGSATLVGSNALIRRTALESIGGYIPGLAEDLATSIELHAAGWQSVYVAAPLAPGLAPSHLHAWFTQQLKWARGVFELLITAYPRLFGRLTWGQRLSYAVRMTYYWIGAVAGIHLLFTFAVLLGGDRVAQVDFHDYLLHFLPVAAAALLIRQLALSLWRGEDRASGLLWRASALVHATWPIYTVALGMALLRLPLSFRPTPKQMDAGINPMWLLPQILTVVLIVSIGSYTLVAGEGVSSVILGFAALQALSHAIVLGYASASITPHERAAGIGSPPHQKSRIDNVLET